MAPEILRYQKYDAKADLWSVGAVLYEMSVGRPPFRAQNHVELLKRIEHARSTVKFPDEDPTSANPDALAVPADIKALIRSLLKNQSHERVDYEEFFKSKALENSRFRKHSKRKDVKASTTASLDEETAQPEQPSNKEPWVYNPDDRIPEAHRVIPPEVLDPKARFPSSQFNFRRKSGSRVSRDALTEANLGTKPDSPSVAQYAERRIS
jgi:serine/threonine-protein kinase ULK2